MRSFEEDFDFDNFEMGATTQKTSNCRIDKYRAMTRDPDRSGDPQHQRRVASHTKRIRREMKELGITKGGRK